LAKRIAIFNYYSALDASQLMIDEHNQDYNSENKMILPPSQNIKKNWSKKVDVFG
jgi:hypothetical protein